MAHKLHLQSVHNHKLLQKNSTLQSQVFKVDDFHFPFLMSSSSIGEGLSAGWKTIGRYEPIGFFHRKKNNYVKVDEIKFVSCRMFQSCFRVVAKAIFNKIALLKRCYMLLLRFHLRMKISQSKSFDSLLTYQPVLVQDQLTGDCCISISPSLTLCYTRQRYVALVPTSLLASET